MAKRKVEDQLEALAALKRSKPTPEIVAQLKKALADPIGLIVGKAADAVATLRLGELVPDMVSAYDRLFEQSVKRDAQCSGKLAIAKALRQLDYTESAPFVSGLYYQQWEPVWGTETDTAGPLRSECSLGVLQCTDLLRDDKLLHLTRGLTDALAAVRLDVARALEEVGGRESILLLRLKARMGDKDSTVTGQAFHSLLGVEGAAAIPFVNEFIEQRGWPVKDQEVSEAAALALGTSRLREGLELLTTCWNNRLHQRIQGEVILRAISSSRQETALDFLIAIIRDGRQVEAIAAVDALGLHRDSESIRARVLEAIEEQDNPEMAAAFQRAFR